jgi:hypothetical protein
MSSTSECETVYSSDEESESIALPIYSDAWMANTSVIELIKCAEIANFDTDDTLKSISN